VREGAQGVAEGLGIEAVRSVEFQEAQELGEDLEKETCLAQGFNPLVHLLREEDQVELILDPPRCRAPCRRPIFRHGRDYFWGQGEPAHCRQVPYRLYHPQGMLYSQINLTYHRRSCRIDTFEGYYWCVFISVYIC